MNNPKSRQQWILEQLTQRPTLSFVDCFSEYSGIYRRSEKTFSIDWNKSKEKHMKLQQAAGAAKEAAFIASEVEATKKGIRTKHERLLILQKQVDNTIGELELNTTKEVRIRGGKAISIPRELNVYERNQMRKVLRDLQAEISKIEGDYAPTKIQGVGAIAFTPVPERS